MQSNVLLLLPARGRQVAYIVFGLIGLGVGAAQVWYAQTSNVIPSQLDGALAVVGFLSIPFSALAASNVAKDRPARVIEPEVGSDDSDSDQPDTGFSIGH